MNLWTKFLVSTPFSHVLACHREMYLYRLAFILHRVKFPFPTQDTVQLKLDQVNDPIHSNESSFVEVSAAPSLFFLSPFFSLQKSNPIPSNSNQIQRSELLNTPYPSPRPPALRQDSSPTR